MKDENGGTGSFSDNKFCPLSAVDGWGWWGSDVMMALKVLSLDFSEVIHNKSIILKITLSN